MSAPAQTPPTVQQQLGPYVYTLRRDINMLLGLAAQAGPNPATIEAGALETLIGHLSLVVVKLEDLR
jgi:hypothetical protein